MKSNKKMNKVAELLEDHGFVDVVLFREPDYETAFLGVTTKDNAVYDFDLMVEYLVENNICEDWDEAADFILFNDSFSMGGARTFDPIQI